MLPASLAAWVPVFIATATSAWASAGASLVPSPVMATRCPCCWYSRIRSSLRSGVASARKSSTPASAAMADAVSGLSPVIITVRMPMRRSSAKRSRMPPLTMSLRWTTPSTRRPVGHQQRRRRPARARSSAAAVTSARHRAALVADERARRRPRRPCGSSGRRRRRRSSGSARRTARSARRGPAGPGRAGRSRSLASTTMLRPSGVSSARDASWAASASSRSVTPGAGTKATASRLPRVIVPVLSSSSTSTSPAASTARPDIASTLAWTMPVHARRCRWPTAGRRWSWGSGRRAARPAPSA